MSVLNGLNFRRNFYGNEVAKFDIEEALRLRKQRILNKENEGNNETIIKTLCEIKHSFSHSKIRATRTTGISNCTCWYMYNEFLSKDIQDKMESDENNEINIFNKSIMNRFCSFLKHSEDLNDYSDPVTWDIFSKNDSVNRLIFDIPGGESADMIDELKLKKLTDERWSVLKQYFDYFTTAYNDHFLNFISRLCQKSVKTVYTNGYDLALLHSLQHTGQLKANEERPIVYIIKCRCLMDYLLVPLLFKHMGIPQPVCIVGESPYVLNMKLVLSRLGYLIVRNEHQLNFPTLQSFIVDKKTSMILEARRSICLVLNDSLNSYVDSIGEPTEMKALLSVVNSFIDGKLNDPILVPMSLCHEFIPKQFFTKSQSYWLPNSWMFLNMMSEQFGIVKLSVCKPVYYSQCMGIPDLINETSTTKPKAKITGLIKHFSWFGTESQLVMPTHLVAFLIMYHYKGKKTISVEDMANVANDLIQNILPLEFLAFQESPMITIIRRGCNVLSNLLSVSEDKIDRSKFNISFDYDDYRKMSDIDFYANVVVDKLVLKAVAATAFSTLTQLTPSMEYLNQIRATDSDMNECILNITDILLSRNFQFLLPCKSHEDEVSKINNWWNEAMVTPTRATDSLCIDNDYNSKDYKKVLEANLDWRADIYDERIRGHITLLTSCLAPRFEALNFLLTEFMRLKQVGVDNMTHCTEVYQKYVQSIKKASKTNCVNYRSCVKSEYFLSALITLHAHGIVKIMDMSTRRWLEVATGVDLLSPRYSLLDCEYYNLQQWKTYVDIARIDI